MLQPTRVPLVTQPTPLVQLVRLGELLDGANIWMKRDDLTGLEVSGNKVRKLEFVVADALASGCDTLVTEGTPQSNHCRAVAAVCARLGLHSMLLFRPEAGEIQGNHLLDVLFGAQTRSYARAEFEARREQIVAGVLDELKATGRRPRWTPMGASEPLGCWGYIRAMGELAEQLEAQGIRECNLIMAISSGATYCGTLLGVLLNRISGCRVRAVPVSDDVAYHSRAAADLCRAAIERYSLPVEFDEGLLEFVDGYVGEGYAIPYPAAIETIRLVARTEAIVLDPVYTGKAFTAVLDLVRRKKLGVERPVVFLHTGGVFSNFAWPETLLQPPI